MPSATPYSAGDGRPSATSNSTGPVGVHGGTTVLTSYKARPLEIGAIGGVTRTRGVRALCLVQTLFFLFKDSVDPGTK